MPDEVEAAGDGLNASRLSLSTSGEREEDESKEVAMYSEGSSAVAGIGGGTAAGAG